MYMSKRHIIVNRKFQINIAVSFAVITALTMTVIIVIISSVLILNNIKLDKITRNQHTLAETSGEIFKSLIGLSEAKKLRNMHLSTKLLIEDNEKTGILIEQNIEEIRKITERNEILIMVLIISAIIQSAIVFYLMLKRSHRISGPIFLLNRYINELKSGNTPVIRPIRAHDDFHELFDNFRELVEKLKKSI